MKNHLKKKMKNFMKNNY
ncbi:hypothetical protein MXB_4690 [Myxobolus squamalis]|nr:hypothetical protein MXB_4690 [Myxobolus squamalis]